MRILVISDTHRSIGKCIDLINRVNAFDVILHLGDVVSDAHDINNIFPNISLYSISGNNDFSNREPYEKLIILEDKRIFLTHGHLHGVKRGYDRLIEAGKKSTADIILFGHTHEGYSGIKNGVHILNPGSACGKYGENATYGIIEIENGKIGTCIMCFGGGIDAI